MKKFIVNSFFYLFKKNKIFLEKVFYFNLNRLQNDRVAFEDFVQKSGNTFYNELEKYPSLFNNGYRHIDKAIELARYLKIAESDMIIDVGAASGIVSMRFSKAFPDTPIYSFEPIPDTFQLLKETTKGGSNITIFNKALGNEVKQIEIHLASRITSSSLLNIEKNLSNEFWKTNLTETGTVQVQLAKMDIEIPKDKKVGILKMDVQGFELEVLKGGAETLKRTGIVLVELQNHELYVGAPKYYDIDEFLRKNNFELYNMIPSIRLDEKIYEWDAIYVNKSLIKS